MSLDAETPDPPELRADVDADNYDDVDVDGEEYRREDLDELLADGAWADGFDEWAEHTDLDEDEWAVVRDLSMVEQFDFFWDDFADRVGYHAPGIPEDWKERDLHPELDSWGTVSGINAAMTELGDVVAEHLGSRAEWTSEFDADFDDEQSDPGS